MPKPYNRRWQKARQTYLRNNPLCVWHKRDGKVVASRIVDHIIPHRNDMKLFWDTSNWQALCKSCHDSHKQRLEKSGVILGCDEDGIPTDPGHHWSRGGAG
ncbi:MAG: HNH endonuclease [Spongiibacteraceae bacterium]|uniref:HNH endonuclease n=1 Tax=uncultured Haliea sp. TaxID=622616 RepID=UPI000C642FB3|nr:HNH endonuclease [Spongiibacteraceae bacterium]|tara:strand:+ start:13532 stop:13834 length:303 start_codon:yes stop_codon:yes gene_type:complete